MAVAEVPNRPRLRVGKGCPRSFSNGALFLGPSLLPASSLCAAVEMVLAKGKLADDPRDADALASAIEAVRVRADPDLSRAVAERFPVNEMLDRVVETLTCDSSS